MEAVVTPAPAATVISSATPVAASSGFSGWAIFFFVFIFLILIAVIVADIYFANQIFTLSGQLIPSSTTATTASTTNNAQTIQNYADYIFWINVGFAIFLGLIIIIAIIYYAASAASAAPSTVVTRTTTPAPAAAVINTPTVPTTPVTVQSSRTVDIPLVAPLPPATTPGPTTLVQPVVQQPVVQQPVYAQSAGPTYIQGPPEPIVNQTPVSLTLQPAPALAPVYNPPPGQRVVNVGGGRYMVI
jgi:hypothetical protein